MNIKNKIISLFSLCLFFNSIVIPVKASVNNFSSFTNITEILTGFDTGAFSPSPTLYTTQISNNYKYKRLRVATVIGNTPTITSTNLININVYAFKWTKTDNGKGITLYCDKDDATVLGVTYRVFVCIDDSTDSINWSQAGYSELSNTYQYNNGGIIGEQILYNTASLDNNSSNSRYFTSYFYYGGTKLQDNVDIAHIRFTSSGQDYTTVLGVVSGNLPKPWPWSGTNSSGGMYWQDGTELDSENVSKYSQIFIVMDENHDNTVTQSEVYYYNQTYNTNYDYSEINNGDPFDQNQFLYAIALLIENGNENPGGGTGSGGGSSAVGGGINVTDSFTQSQTQSIAENAVNVNITNNNELTQENLQSINQIINQSVNTGGNNPFEESISNMNQFLGVAHAFSALASAVLGFLPWWVTALLTLVFTILFVMVIFRLIHLFV